MNVIAHYLSTAFKSLDPEEAVSLYSKKFHSTTITTITPVPELHDPLFIHKDLAYVAYRGNSPICLTDFSSHL